MTQEEITCGKCEKTKDICNCGRPSKYKEEFVDMANEYLDTCIDDERELTRKRGDEETVYDFKLKVNLPTLKGFASYIGVNDSTLYEWEKKHPMFSNALDKIREEQQSRLINNGLSGDYNPTIAKLILSSNHGMSEKTIQENQGEMKVEHVITGMDIT